jgi:hypothetical protein
MSENDGMSSLLGSYSLYNVNVVAKRYGKMSVLKVDGNGGPRVTPG